MSIVHLSHLSSDLWVAEMELLQDIISLVDKGCSLVLNILLSYFPPSVCHNCVTQVNTGFNPWQLISTESDRSDDLLLLQEGQALGLAFLWVLVS